MFKVLVILHQVLTTVQLEGQIFRDVTTVGTGRVVADVIVDGSAFKTLLPITSRHTVTSWKTCLTVSATYISFAQHTTPHHVSHHAAFKILRFP